MNVASLVQVVAGLAWLAVVALIAMVVARSSRGQAAKGLTSSVGVVIVVAVILTAVGAGIVFIQPDERGVVTSAFDPKGYRSEALQPGLRWVIPFGEQVTLYKISRQTYTMSSATTEGTVQGDDSIPARTKDGQQVQIDASVIYSLDPNKVVDLHIIWQNRYEDSVVRPVSRSVIRDAVAQYGVEEVVSTKRVELEKLITDRISAQFANQNLKLSDFLLRNITFSDEYAKAVEQKQIAEQQALQAQLIVGQKRQEAEQARQTAQGQADAAVIAAKGAANARVIQAEAEAQALQLVADVLKQNPNLLQYQYITKLAPNVQVMIVPSNAPFILPQLPVTPSTTGPTSTPQ
jgi:regulator of protease activity HflC (stomatin/prohibitin superfamily)